MSTEQIKPLNPRPAPLLGRLSALCFPLLALAVVSPAMFNGSYMHSGVRFYAIFGFLALGEVLAILAVVHRSTRTPTALISAVIWTAFWILFIVSP